MCSAGPGPCATATQRGQRRRGWGRGGGEARRKGEKEREREPAVCVQGALARTEHAGGSRRYVWNYHVQSAHGRVERVDQGQISEACESPGTAASEAEGERERESRENGDSSNCVSRARSHGG